MRTTTVKGTNDYLPAEVELRDFMQSTILHVYQSNGFERIMTPAIEDIDNLDKSDGGDNLNLIFKVLKRGEKLSKAIHESKFDDLADMGLRYDLTLPLSRYFANNKSQLTMPFKCIQIDKVYRAERPQKGRLRELVQCDIDIIGSESNNCEIELIDVTAKALLAIGLTDFKVRINDRQLLKSILLSMHFQESQLDSVCISFDKLGKIGITGVKRELLEKGLEQENVENLVSFLGRLPLKISDIKALLPEQEAAENLESIIYGVERLASGRYNIEFDLSLVRGQGYYTGTVFEVESIDFKGSIAGGGRYDNLIGKFVNETVPAVGFSIGFERIFCILSERSFSIPNQKKKIAILYDDFFEANNIAESFRSDFSVTLFEKPKKVGKYLSRLQKNGYYGYFICGYAQDITLFVTPEVSDK